VEEQSVLVLVQIVETNGTLEPTLDSRKSDGADGVIIITTSFSTASFLTASFLKKGISLSNS
jgi:hypothetical protein